MSTFDKIKLLLIALQPMMWWVIYSLLYPIAKKMNDDAGLSFVCIISALISIALLFISVAHKDFDK